MGYWKNGKASRSLQESLHSDSAREYNGLMTLLRGDVNSRVYDLQYRLSQLKYPVGYIDGNYGTRTYNAIMLFQQQAGLEPTGTADIKTQELLYSYKAPVYVEPTPTPDPFIDYGDGLTARIIVYRAKYVQHANRHRGVRQLRNAACKQQHMGESAQSVWTGWLYAFVGLERKSSHPDAYAYSDSHTFSDL